MTEYKVILFRWQQRRCSVISKQTFDNEWDAAEYGHKNKKKHYWLRIFKKHGNKTELVVEDIPKTKPSCNLNVIAKEV